MLFIFIYVDSNKDKLLPVGHAGLSGAFITFYFLFTFKQTHWLTFIHDFYMTKFYNMLIIKTIMGDIFK